MVLYRKIKMNRTEQLIFELMDAPCHPEPIDWDWFCNNAKLFTEVNKKTSVSLAERHGCKMKECYYNTWKVDIIGEYTYYEGYAIRNDLSLNLAHSWLTDQMNRVIDPTLAVSPAGYADRYVGVSIDRDWLNKIAFKLKRTGDFLPQWYEQHR